eukprot:3579-Heterococcus_DN1.PRE.1
MQDSNTKLLTLAVCAVILASIGVAVHCGSCSLTFAPVVDLSRSAAAATMLAVVYVLQIACLKLKDADVSQSTFALIGECAQ